MAHIETAALFVIWTAIFVVGLYIVENGLIWSNERPLNYLIAGTTIATTGGYGLYKDFIAGVLERVIKRARRLCRAPA